MDSNFLNLTQFVCISVMFHKIHNGPILTLDGTPIPVVEKINLWVLVVIGLTKGEGGRPQTS